ncbi:F-box domain, cyclin-like protein [Cordyceps fumosorosea ARSEF 2679]|uniref:F-box domain, cyclin-like protein n=1 Tax=Cordyceps fumosorosea (strain ARSEF 2679) TaxID=1081104 RepID=A0A162JSV6_CORFA|nr:F-box domain, cyclin-like protein [Cordyceps fumosorosea ARSEF 2679]OAA73282.1 F-box domain, cyclin-like protein [Cordyceps fumosorosea ARSEF 2679]
MQVTWRRRTPPPTPNRRPDPRRSSRINDSDDDDEHNIRRVGHLTLCKLRDAIARAQALSRSSWAAASAFSRHGPARADLTTMTPPTPGAPAAAVSRASATTMALTDLPYTVFAEIASHLSPCEAIAARRVSRTVYAALTRAELCISLLLRHFPRARESRELRTLLRRGDAALLEAVRWADALAATARRYHHLGAATPRTVDTIRVAREDHNGGLLRGVTPWHRFLRLDDKTAAFHHWDPAWACDATAGLLVHPVEGWRYVLRDVDSGCTWPVPFGTVNRLVRRVRLAHGLLVFEWCEKQPVGEEDDAHRHFATAYDVRRMGRPDGVGVGREDELYTLRRYRKVRRDDEAEVDECAVTFRCEWKIHSLGIPLRHQDRFFSAHNSTHYVVYIWQSSRSPWGEDEPLERLIIWDISVPSPSSAPAPSSGGGGEPRIIAQLDGAQLDHWGVRQRGAPALRCLALDDCTRDSAASAACGHVFIVEEEHRWSAGPHSSPTPPRLHHVKATGIPLSGSGPRWVDECGGGGVQSDAGGMPFCWRPADGAETWAGRCPCWRHDDFPYLTVCEVRDVQAGVRFSARHCFMLETLSVHVKPRLRVHGVPRPAPHTPRRLSSSTKTSSSHGGRNAKLTTVLGGAGEYKSRRGRASEAVREGRDNLGAGSESEFDGSDAIAREVQFGDDAWPMLLNAGYICGDERWLIGEATDGSITIMHF